jgi:hypothetical protein
LTWGLALFITVLLISVSDACTSDDSGATIGLIRVIAYE